VNLPHQLPTLDTLERTHHPLSLSVDLLLHLLYDLHCVSLPQKKTRSATANSSRVSIRGRPCKCFPHTVQYLVVVSHTVCACVGDPKMLGTLAPPLRMGGGRGWPRKHASPHLCYRAKFGHSRSHHTT